MRKQSEWLKGLKVETPQVTEETFVVFPLTTQSFNGRGYITLDEAIQQGLVYIPESGRVPEIIIVVKGEKPVLVVEGTVVVGGLQNRTVNISLLLEANKEHRIPVSCVERGRWHFRHRRFYHEPTIPSRRRFEREEREREEREKEPAMFEVAAFAVHANLRRIKTISAVHSHLLRSAPVAEQREVWSEVQRKLSAAQVHSPTEDETVFYERHFSSIEDLLRPMKPLENQVGALVAIGQEIVGLEVFDHPETWHVMHRKILSSYAADALESLGFRKPKALVTTYGAKAFLETLANSLDKAYVKPSPVGLGEHFLLDENMTLVGGFALVHNEAILHLFAFPASSIRW
ncbi:MAG: ARPP-1 family domain-containing protein [Armatimonadota bacterium]